MCGLRMGRLCGRRVAGGVWEVNRAAGAGPPSLVDPDTVRVGRVPDSSSWRVMASLSADPDTVIVVGTLKPVYGTDRSSVRGWRAYHGHVQIPGGPWRTRREADVRLLLRHERIAGPSRPRPLGLSSWPSGVPYLPLPRQRAGWERIRNGASFSRKNRSDDSERSRWVIVRQGKCRKYIIRRSCRVHDTFGTARDLGVSRFWRPRRVWHPQD